MTRSSLYETNLELFAKENPLQAALLNTVDCSGMEFCTTETGELNLVENHSEGRRYLYAPEGAYKESELWAKIPPLHETDALFVFGLGLGYYYFPLKAWLEEDPKRQLVFLEDDPRIIRFFLATDWAAEILQHPQVLIKPIPEVTPDEKGWEKLREAIGTMPLFFTALRPNISALQGYFMFRFPYFHFFATQWLTILAQGTHKLSEFLYDPYTRFKSYYANLPYIGSAAPGEWMEGALRNIPAILCGAGRSLDKQLPLLSSLCDKAFVMAPASAMNPLVGASILPHLGGAIDPGRAQLSRLMARSGNDVPLLYQEFYNHSAFTEWHGPKVHLFKGSGFNIPKWFEKALGLDSDQAMISGVSTSNYLLQAAAFLGCNPIILIGMDLSFNETKRYSEGVLAHPTDENWLHSGIKRKDDGLISFPGYQGKDVVTNRLWFQEAACVSAFKLSHPEISLINCTEGGLRIIHVEEKPFKQVAEDLLDWTWDIQGWFHGERENALLMAHGEAPVFSAMAQWERSLIRCQMLLNALIENDINSVSSGAATLYQVELAEEPAYRNFLATYDHVYDLSHFLEERTNQRKLALEEFRQYEKQNQLGKWRYLLDHCIRHINWLREGVESYKERENELQNIVEGALTVYQFLLNPTDNLYEANEGRLRIEDRELGISLVSEFDPPLIAKEMLPKGGEVPPVEARLGTVSGVREGQTLYFYEDGKIKVEAYYRQGKLHGPWTYYGRQGGVLSRSWFVNGIREGKSLLYHTTGRVYSHQGYRNGLRQGRQLYFYPNGVLKSSEHYQDGVLTGDLTLYHENGRIKMQQHFVDGKLNGVERFFSVDGKLFAEATYDNGNPEGISNRWHANGILARQVTHTKEGNLIIEWDEQGNQINNG